MQDVSGGWDLACQEIGIAAVGVEIDKDCNNTRQAARLYTVPMDVREVEPSAWTRLGLGEESIVDILIASPPCQDFSVAGKRLGLNSERGRLVYEVQRFYRTLKPDYIACEQVPGVLPIWEEFARELDGLGYWTWTGLLQAEQYGVPQTRKRAILMARKVGGPISPPVPTHSRYYPRKPTKLDEGVLPWVSMQEALGWDGELHTLRDQRENHLQTRETDKPCPFISTKTSGQFHYLATHTTFKDNMHLREVTKPAQVITEHLRDSVFASTRPSPTISAGGTATGGAEQIANAKLRKKIGRLITVQEAAILQTFPENYPWQGCKSSQFKQIGNAIPPKLAEVILRSLIYG